ncbi:hypothetical protein RRG08_018801 [Elysia crispata]|uniref:Uncharacterized protein n=1 Tax=Elysia crispata TaxID=231223 RepID=A0AAE1DL58_9GAST|nr:hypothetical protein RRG08_018801 [Elysia crispata]
MGRNTRGDTTAPHACAMTCAIIVAWLVLLVIAGESFVLLNLTHTGFLRIFCVGDRVTRDLEVQWVPAKLGKMMWVERLTDQEVEL